MYSVSTLTESSKSDCSVKSWVFIKINFYQVICMLWIVHSKIEEEKEDRFFVSNSEHH